MQTAKEFLAQLIGRWDLTGQMGDMPLQQSVEAKWTLGDLFVEMHVKSTLAAPNGKIYEAIYFIGYNAEKDLYVMHLLDTFGATSASLIGLGKREGEAIAFVFNYESGPFTNKFIYDAANDEWIMQQTYVAQRQVKTFATKKMRRHT